VENFSRVGGVAEAKFLAEVSYGGGGEAVDVASGDSDCSEDDAVGDGFEEGVDRSGRAELVARVRHRALIACS